MFGCSCEGARWTGCGSRALLYFWHPSQATDSPVLRYCRGSRLLTHFTAGSGKTSILRSRRAMSGLHAHSVYNRQDRILPRDEGNYTTPSSSEAGLSQAPLHHPIVGPYSVRYYLIGRVTEHSPPRGRMQDQIPSFFAYPTDLITPRYSLLYHRRCGACTAIGYVVNGACRVCYDMIYHVSPPSTCLISSCSEWMKW